MVSARLVLPSAQSMKICSSYSVTEHARLWKLCFILELSRQVYLEPMRSKVEAAELEFLEKYIGPFAAADASAVPPTAP